MRTARLSMAVATATLAIGSATTHAGLLVYDGFNYTTTDGTNINGAAAPLSPGGNSGFASSSTYSASGTTVKTYQNSLVYSGTFAAGSGLLPFSAGRISSEFTNGGSGGGNGSGLGGFRSADGSTYTGVAQGGRPFGTGSTSSTPATPAVGTYYYSFLWSPNNSQTQGYFNVMGINDATGTQNNNYQGGIGIRFINGSIATNQTTFTNAGAGVPGITAAANAVYLIVGKASYNGAASANQIWVNPTDFSTGVPTGGYQSGGGNPTTINATGVTQTITSRSNSFGNGFYVDEVRVGTSLLDVVAIPEPTMASALIGLGSLGLLRRRRHA